MRNNKYLQSAKKLIDEIGLISQQKLKAQQYEMGIDEAGRGPVFGAMIYSSLWWPLKYKEQMEKLGFDDSKKLTQTEREKIFEAINYLNGKVLFYKVEILTPQRISNLMMASGIHHQNLNQISHNSAIGLIQDALNKNFKIKQVYLDTVGTQSKYEDKIYSEISKSQITVKVSKKADSIYKVVGAASVAAKVTRDKIIENWQFPEKVKFVGELGSGYPGDPKTVAWLKNNQDEIFGYPNLIRFSWNTISNQFEEKLLFIQEIEHKKKYKTQIQKRFRVVTTGKQLFSQF